jgi:hypothetical protein
MVDSVAIGSRLMYWNHAHHHEEAGGEWARLSGGPLVIVAQEMFRSRIIRRDLISCDRCLDP